MGLLTIILLVVIVISVVTVIPVFTRKRNNSDETLRKINRIRSAGLFALIFGLLGQLIGLFSAFRAIKIGEVEASPSIMVEGFKVSMITTISGILIFLISLFIWSVLSKTLENK